MCIIPVYNFCKHLIKYYDKNIKMLSDSHQKQIIQILWSKPNFTKQLYIFKIYLTITNTV